MADSHSFPNTTDYDEDPSVVELIRDLLVAHLLRCSPSQRLQHIRNAVLKFHEPLLCKSWHISFKQNQTVHPILNEMKSPSIDLAITLICSQKHVIDLVQQETDNVANHALLTTVVAMNNILIRRNICLGSHLCQIISTIKQKLYSMDHEKFKIFARDNFCKKMKTFSSCSELMDCIPDKKCAICLESDISADDFAILDNCRHIFCAPCISLWSTRKK